MLRLRLQRRGKRNFATYRVVVAERGAPIKGKYVADVGWYNPHSDEFKVDKDKVTKWLGNGVLPTATVHNLLVTHGVIKADKVTSWRPKKREEEEKKNEEGSTEQTQAKEGEEKEKTAKKEEEDGKDEGENKGEDKKEVKEEK